MAPKNSFRQNDVTFNTIQNKANTIYNSQEGEKTLSYKESFNMACDLLAKTMEDQKLYNTAKSILSYKGIV